VQRGSSGATFTFLGDRVVKKHPGVDRVMQQGMWLQRHCAPALPHVFQTYAHSYVMERLISPAAMWLNHSVVLLELLCALDRDVWSRDAEVKYDALATRAKLAQLLVDFDLRDCADQLTWLTDAIDWSALRSCLAHGDPTFDNVMFRESTGELVIVDPLPAMLAVPDLRSVDTGKILQSIIGWERVRYGDTRHAFRGDIETLRTYVADENEWLATVFWCFVHLARTLPYVPSELINPVKELARDALAHVTRR
jgi:hypothetical protein